MKKILIYGTVVVLIELVGTPLSAQQITAPMRQQDPRLERQVQIESPRLRIGEILQSLSRQTGVTLRLSPRHLASGITVVVSLRDTSLAAAMNALLSLVSLRHYSWRWEREKQGAEYIYQLRPVHLEAMASAQQKMVQDAFEKQAALLMQAAMLSPEERKKQMERSEYLDPMMSDPRVLAGNRILMEALSTEQMQRLFRRREMFKIPTNRLSAESQAFIRSESHSGPELLTGYAIIAIAQNSFDISPTLYIDFGLGGMGYVGGIPLKNEMRSRVYESWMLPEDRRDDPRSSHRIEARTEDDASSVREGETPPFAEAAERDLLRFASSASLNMLAIAPFPPESLERPEGMTVADYLQRLSQSREKFIHKWREGVLLICYPHWFAQADTSVPLQTIETLRALRISSPERLLEKLADVTHPLTSDQLNRLKNELPLVQTVVSNRSLFQLIRRFPEVVRRPSGVPLREEMLPFLQQPFAGVEVRMPAQVKRVRIRIVPPTADNRAPTRSDRSLPPTTKTMLWLELLDDRGGLLGGGGSVILLGESLKTP